jgi:uncharacterized protein (TIGR03083 family)
MAAGRVPRHVAYRTVREHVADITTRSPDAAGTPVPACPEWTVRDVVAHLAGNSAGMLGERSAGNGAGLAELLGWWGRTGPQVERQAAEDGLEIGRLLMDAFTHELDLREALGVGPPPDHPAYPVAFDVVAGGLSWSLVSRGLPALRLACEDGQWLAGAGAPAATVTASRHELYRCLTGRRTPEQIAALDWTADPTRWLAAFYWGPFTPPVPTPR